MGVANADRAPKSEPPSTERVAATRGPATSLEPKLHKILRLLCKKRNDNYFAQTEGSDELLREN